jgi:hypothetical protein
LVRGTASLESVARVDEHEVPRYWEGSVTTSGPVSFTPPPRSSWRNLREAVPEGREHAANDHLPSPYWELAWIAVKDHPYTAVTDEQGRFEIRNVPAGKQAFMFWQERVETLPTAPTSRRPITGIPRGDRQRHDVDMEAVPARRVVLSQRFDGVGSILNEGKT